MDSWTKDEKGKYEDFNSELPKKWISNQESRHKAPSWRRKANHNRRQLKFQLRSWKNYTKLVQMAEIEYQRIQNLSKNEAETYPAHLFDGPCIAISFNRLTQEEKSYIQEHLPLTSSLYGAIPALVRLPSSAGSLVGPAQWSNAENLGGTIIQSSSGWRYKLLSVLSSEFGGCFENWIEKMFKLKIFRRKSGQTQKPFLLFLKRRVGQGSSFDGSAGR